MSGDETAGGGGRPSSGESGPHQATSAQELSTQLREVLALAALARPALARRLGLSATEVWAIEHLLGAPLGPVELGRRLDITSASSTVLVRRLEAAGHVRRERHPSDRRRTVLRVTESATTRVRERIEPLARDVEAAGEALSAAEREAVAGYLRQVGQALGRLVGPPAAAGTSTSADARDGAATRDGADARDGAGLTAGDGAGSA